MNKIAKILSVVLSVSLVIGVTVAMLVSAFAVTAPKFSISVAEENKDSVKLALCLESGSITSCGVNVKAADWNNPNKTTGLTIKSVERGQAFRDFATAHENDKVPPLIAINTDRGFGEASFASVAAYSEKGVMLYFTFAKGNSAKAKIEPSDIVVEFDGVVVGDNKDVTPTLDNQIPAPVAPTTTTTTTKKADDPTTTTTKKADVTTTTKKADVTTTTKKADVTTTTKAAEDVTTTTKAAEDVTTTTKAAEDVTTTTKAAEDVTTTTKAAEDVTTTTKAAEDITSSTKSDDVVTTAPAADTTTAASSSDVVNPETGDRLTASAAVVALLAISGAAVVALRKKED